MSRPLSWALSAGVVVLAAAGCGAAPPAPAVTTTCGPPQTNQLAPDARTATTAGCTALEFTAPGTYTVTVKFPPAGAHTTIDY
ncbi:MAG TPA: hypothetical protein VJS67_12350, partial [Pseudonocardiaceae bacterium]|nr:hypothetical protein [Pseudonocardiaceae bacterium]